MSTPERVKEIRSQIKKMNDGSIVGVTSTKSPKNEKFEINVSNRKVSKFDSVYKIIYTPKGKVEVFHAKQPQLAKIKAGKTKSQTRISLSEGSFTEVTSQFVD